MADDIPVGGGQQGQGQGFLQNIDQGLNNFFGPINRGLERTFGGKPDPRRQLLMALSAFRPGVSMMPPALRSSFMGPRAFSVTNPSSISPQMSSPAYNSQNVANAVRGMPDFPAQAQSGMVNQPANPPVTSQLIYQALGRRANNQGFLEQTRNERFHNPNMRPQTFIPEIERQLMPGDAVYGTRVMTPANRTPDQSYNLALIKQLMGK